MSTVIVDTVGYFTFKPPWVSVNYALTAVKVESIDYLLKNNADVYKTYYQPMGLSEDVFQTDVDNNEDIITFVSEVDDLIEIPSSYVEPAPFQKNLQFNRFLLSVDLGKWPNDMTFIGLENDIRETVINHIGLDKTIKLYKLPLQGVVSQKDWDLANTTRQQLISQLATTKKTIDALMEDNQQLRNRITALESIIVNIAS